MTPDEEGALLLMAEYHEGTSRERSLAVIRAAAAIERGMCVKVCDEIASGYGENELGAQACSAAIRSLK